MCHVLAYDETNVFTRILETLQGALHDLRRSVHRYPVFERKEVLTDKYGENLILWTKAVSGSR